MTERRATRLLCVASAVALLALGLVVWSVLDPRPLLVIGAMSVGQGLGTLSFGLFLVVVAVDIRRGWRSSAAASEKGEPEAPITTVEGQGKP